jgi:hypothetical protein
MFLGIALGGVLIANIVYILLSILGYKMFATNTSSITLSGQPVLLGETILQLISNLFYTSIMIISLVLGVVLARSLGTKLLKIFFLLLIASVLLNFIVTILNLANEDIFNFIVNGAREVTFITRIFEHKGLLLFTALRDGITTVLPLMSLGYIVAKVSK